jgi:hypothetical protein
MRPKSSSRKDDNTTKRRPLPALRKVPEPRGDVLSLPEHVLPSDKPEHVAWLARVISRKKEQPDRKERLAPAGKMKPGPQSRKDMVLALRAELYPKGLQGRPVTEVRDHLRRS